MKTVLADTSLTQATIYFNYYVNRAIVTAGLGNLYIDQLGIWKQNLALGLTTWAEMSNVSASRSDCHAWGASPNIELLRTVLGIDSDAPGFARIRISPHLGTLSKASGSMPHPKGTITAAYELKKGSLKAQIYLPKGTNGVFLFGSTHLSLHEGENMLTVKQ